MLESQNKTASHVDHVLFDFILTFKVSQLVSGYRYKKVWVLLSESKTIISSS